MYFSFIPELSIRNSMESTLRRDSSELFETKTVSSKYTIAFLHLSNVFSRNDILSYSYIPECVSICVLFTSVLNSLIR